MLKDDKSPKNFRKTSKTTFLRDNKKSCQPTTKQTQNISSSSSSSSSSSLLYIIIIHYCELFFLPGPFGFWLLTRLERRRLPRTRRCRAPSREHRDRPWKRCSPQTLPTQGIRPRGFEKKNLGLNISGFKTCKIYCIDVFRKILEMSNGTFLDV